MVMNAFKRVRTFEADCEVWQASTSNSISNPGALPFPALQSIGIDAHILFWTGKDNYYQICISGDRVAPATRSRLTSQVVPSFHDLGGIAPQGIVNHVRVETLFYDQRVKRRQTAGSKVQHESGIAQGSLYKREKDIHITTARIPHWRPSEMCQRAAQEAQRGENANSNHSVWV